MAQISRNVAALVLGLGNTKWCFEALKMWCFEAPFVSQVVTRNTKRLVCRITSNGAISGVLKIHLGRVSSHQKWMQLGTPTFGVSRSKNFCSVQKSCILQKFTPGVLCSGNIWLQYPSLATAIVPYQVCHTTILRNKRPFHLEDDEMTNSQRTVRYTQRWPFGPFNLQEFAFDANFIHHIIDA